ncbi:Harbinger transposase-derived nuclease [Arachis hypogaea]|nr:Harbinger transposase-derived nuclease [Arachis hypogaea]
MRKKTVLASESWWTDKIKINPEFAKFKNEGPKSLDRLEQCFKDIVATGYSAWAPSEDPNPEEFNQNNEGFESGGDMNYTNEFIEEDIANYTVVQSPTREKRRKTSKKKVEKRAGIVSRLQDSLDHILVGVESKAATKGDDPYSIENCIKLLRKLPATKGDDPYSVFNRLCNDLVLNYGLKSTRSVSGEEMVATFLYMLGQGASYRMLEERFQHSGSAHDTRIFMEALRTKKLNFPHPPEGKYYLVDAGYPTFKGFLGPYRHTRMMDSDDISILQKFEDIVSLQANEDDGTTVRNGSTNSEINEWEEPTQEDVRVIEEIRDNIRDQLSD